MRGLIISFLLVIYKNQKPIRNKSHKYCGNNTSTKVTNNYCKYSSYYFGLLSISIAPALSRNIGGKIIAGKIAEGT